MSEEDWCAGFAKSLMVFLNGDALPDAGPHGEKIKDDSFVVMLNAHWEALVFSLPVAASARPGYQSSLPGLNAKLRRWPRGLRSR